MIATSTVVMFGLMYLNTYELGHIYFRETRTYMAILMGASMAIIMLGFMLHMYNNRRINTGILGGSILVFALSLWNEHTRLSGIDSFLKLATPHFSAILNMC